MRRKLLTSAFHFRILEDFLPIFNEQAQIFNQILADHDDLKPFDIVGPSTMAALDIICGNFGIEIPSYIYHTMT